MSTVDGEPTSTIPRITTARLVLRGLRAGDLDAFAENLADPIATEHLGGVVDRRAAWRVLAAGTGFWMLTGAGWWGIALRETGELVGTVGAFFRETPGADLELGWSVFRRHWRRGYASEAAQAALAFGFERHAVPRAIAHIDGRNAASIRVSARIGMTYEGEVDFYGERTGRYVIARRS
ncbi:MAG: GNAT family N-acetyltransferase [Deltaproteobacteria bacterium]|nr:GNAT family N-acetyltransferase [Myxococcales bacterium]MDP3217844.1 GNAT family N-acetyltransferase [Deltaproteobacteria bacterium]